MCGIVAVIHADTSSDDAAAELHDALYFLQHRGQDACGITTCGSGGRIYQCKGNGMASKVFDDGARVADLPGFMGVGHLRYPTAGSSAKSEAQPFYVNSPYGICLTHNGNLINAVELKRVLDQEAHRHINTDSDSEILLNIFASELNETGKARVNAEDCFGSLERTYAKCKGSWACTAMIAGFGLIGFRDPYGIRPVVIGSRKSLTGKGKDYMIASESVALQFWGCKPEDIQDIKPGQAVIIAKDRAPEYRQVHEQIEYSPDIFEYLYFARPDSIIDGISVESARYNMGVRLANTIKAELGKEKLAQIDVVIPIPETSNTSAHAVAEHLDKKFSFGFVKNRYVFRTFLMGSQKLRRSGVRRKLNPMPAKFQGLNVLLVDDSIVRGNTSREICSMAKEAGAKSIVFASASPPVRYSHIYGIDLASPDELIAHHKTTAEIATAIGADAVIFQTLDDLKLSCQEASPGEASSTYETGVFSGEYVTGIPEGYLEHIEALRAGNKKSKIREQVRQAVANGIATNGDIEEAVSEAASSSKVDAKSHETVGLHNLND